MKNALCVVSYPHYSSICDMVQYPSELPVPAATFKGGCGELPDRKCFCQGCKYLVILEGTTLAG